MKSVSFGNMNNLKVLLFDLETSPNLSWTFGGKYEVNVTAFEKEGYILCFAYKWLGEKTVHSYSLRDLTRKQLVTKLRDLFDEADVLIAHNGNSFDIKMSNREFTYFKLTPPSPYRTLDTKVIAKNKFRFTSNKLDDLGEYLGLGRKIDTGGIELWLGCMEGDTNAWSKMIKYNKQDVVLLEKVYLRLLPYIERHPRLDKTNNKTCPNCGSNKVEARGYLELSNGFRRHKYWCRNCGRWSSGEQERTIDKENILR